MAQQGTLGATHQVSIVFEILHFVQNDCDTETLMRWGDLTEEPLAYRRSKKDKHYSMEVTI